MIDKFIYMESINSSIVFFALIVVMVMLIVLILYLDYGFPKRKKSSKILSHVNVKEEQVLNQVKDDNVLKKKEEKLGTDSHNVDELLSKTAVIEKEELIVKEDVFYTKPIEKIKYVEQSDEQEKENAKLELERLMSTLGEVEEKNQKALDDFTVEQEENAVISLNELMEKSKSTINELSYEDPLEKTLPINIEELKKTYYEQNGSLELNQEKEHNQELDQVVNQVFNTPKAQRFKTSPFISPVFGVEDENNTSWQVGSSRSIEQFDEELQKTRDFINRLKELQKKLD